MNESFNLPKEFQDQMILAKNCRPFRKWFGFWNPQTNDFQLYHYTNKPTAKMRTMLLAGYECYQL